MIKRSYISELLVVIHGYFRISFSKTLKYILDARLIQFSKIFKDGESKNAFGF